MDTQAADHPLQYATRTRTSAILVVLDQPQVLVSLADVYARQGDMTRARERLEDALRFDPQNAGARQRLRLMQQGRTGR